MYKELIKREGEPAAIAVDVFLNLCLVVSALFVGITAANGHNPTLGLIFLGITFLSVTVAGFFQRGSAYLVGGTEEIKRQVEHMRRAFRDH